ncbi:hypothetical protein [Kytococcus sp. HMSC28H12]|uniref:hypothetical protein n=1 Tax=Kytococcus sp. HMSC28H12 TaxID=1581067 RepID=UPI0008A5415B|nr:hypothetical protein [Kytococcus sp. HMSC28H12]OFS14094.1 hypothetical protein HMPREF3099_04860 [Kytococcus sp. HMSC28H12]
MHPITRSHPHDRDLGLDIRSTLLALGLLVALVETVWYEWIGALHVLWVSLITFGVVRCWRALVRHDGWGGGVAAAFLAIPVLLVIVVLVLLHLWPIPANGFGLFATYLPGATAVLCPLLAIGRRAQWTHPDGDPLPDAP